MSSTLILSLILAVSAPSFADPDAADADLHGTGAAGAHDEDGGAAPEDGSSTSDPGMPAADFLAQAPHTLSPSFRLVSVMGVDYANQPDITSKIPTLLADIARRGLSELGFSEHVAALKAEFCAAGSSSLDVALIVDFHASAAPRYDDLERALARLAVEACNEHGWVIPFTQLTLHQAPAVERGKPS